MDISPEKLIMISALISIEIAKGKNISEINIYKNLFNTIANNLQSYCNQKAFNDTKKDKQK